MDDEMKLALALAKAGYDSFESAEKDATTIMREYIVKYGDAAPTALAFAAYKAMRKAPESKDTILLRFAQVILSEAR